MTDVDVGHADGDAAEFRSYVLMTQRTNGSIATVASGVVVGRVRSGDDGLAFSELRVVLDTADAAPTSPIRRWARPRGHGGDRPAGFVEQVRDRFGRIDVLVNNAGINPADMTPSDMTLEEMKIGWLPWFVEATARQSLSNTALGDWPWETSGGDMLRRNVKITPLPGFGDTDALDVVERLPEMCLFSSDYPHMEGNAEPLGVYGPGLESLDAAVRAAFLGGNAAECFARTGDSLPAPSAPAGTALGPLTAS